MSAVENCIVHNENLARRILTPPTVAVLGFLESGTVEHSFDDMLLFDRFMRALHIAPKDAEVRGALLHDIGKIGMDRLVCATDLSPREVEILHEHPLWGVKLVGHVFQPDEVDMQFFAHHERKDGNGYPLGLAGDQIPQHIQAFSIVDAFSAATSDRSYQRALPPEQALESIHRFVEVGWYDRELFHAFASNRDIWSNHVQERQRAYRLFTSLKP